MKKTLKKIIFAVGFLVTSFCVAGNAKAQTNVEEIEPELNIVRSIDDRDQVNMYKTVVDEEGYQNITLNFDETKKDYVNNGWTLRVYDENKEEIYRVEGIKSQFKSGNFSFAKDKVVYISVESTNSGFLFMPKGVEYNLNFHTYKADDYEREPNNKYISANEIEVGKYIKGNLIKQSDEDYYVIKISDKGYTALSFEILDFEPDRIGSGWDIEIYDKNKGILYKEEGIKKDTKFPELPLIKGQEIYIRIKTKTGWAYTAPEGLEYKLQTGFVKTNKWEAEDNNSFNSANKLKGTMFGNILNNEDVDYFTFKASKTGKYKINLNTGDNVDGEYKVEVFVKNKGKTVLEERTKGSKSFTVNAKKGQKIWVRISGGLGSSPIGNKYGIGYKAVKASKTKTAKKNNYR